jgi:hypothetical protein
MSSSGEWLRVVSPRGWCCIEAWEVWPREDMDRKDVRAMSLDGEGWAAAMGRTEARGASSGMGIVDERARMTAAGDGDWIRESRAASVSDVVPMRERILSFRTSSRFGIDLLGAGEGERMLSRGRTGEATSSCCEDDLWSDIGGITCPAIGESTGAARSGEMMEEVVDMTRGFVSGDRRS